MKPLSAFCFSLWATLNKSLACVVASLPGAVCGVAKVRHGWGHVCALRLASRPPAGRAASRGLVQRRLWLLPLLLALAWALPAQAARVKEVAAVQGVRSNLLSGYGLVVGLDGTGDQSTQMPFTAQAMANYLQQMGISLPPGTSAPQLKNVATVAITAELPAFAQPGQLIDVVVSSVGNAKSLRGGTLIATPLRGADGEIYALAQGNVVVGGAGASAGGSKVQINHLSAGRIPDGAQVERSVPTPLNDGETITLGLNASDFQMARKVAQAINARSGPGTATALDGRTVQVRAPVAPGARVAFIAELEELQLPDTTPAAKVVINARTGSVVLNQAVTLGPCAIAHGSLSVTISSTPVISQPNPLSQGQTVVAQKSDITIQQQGGQVLQVPAAPQLADVVRALNALGATPQDLLAILQAIKAAGALNAELEVI
ncbi:MAG: flagellar basal body P-ring protein FlgI [Comamonadaceae bacterium]|nr:flagellar basal body P-ring protein FlgI [Burkholderiales bacterium]MEB2348508.1 flagellar basal body P-ring protein FlgI [Comamonadaceae bacterium]